MPLEPRYPHAAVLIPALSPRTSNVRGCCTLFIKAPIAPIAGKASPGAADSAPRGPGVASDQKEDASVSLSLCVLEKCKLQRYPLVLWSLNQDTWAKALGAVNNFIGIKDCTQRGRCAVLT